VIDLHLHGETLEHYLDRTLPPRALDAIDVHVSNCLSCAHAIAGATTATVSWERRGLLGRLVRD
jgi:hypothetical protein